jgi:hypothetical protein
VVKFELQFHRLKRNQLGAISEVCGLVEGEGALERRDPLLVHLAEHTGQTAVVCERGSGGAIGITDLRGEEAGFEQRLSKALLSNLALGLT